MAKRRSLGPRRAALNQMKRSHQRQALAPRPVAPCTLCVCDSEGEVFGYKVCGYHLTHGEDDPPCPNCHQDVGPADSKKS